LYTIEHRKCYNEINGKWYNRGSKQVQGGFVVSEHASEHKTSNKQTSVQSKTNTAEMEAPTVMDARQLTPARIMQLQRTLGNRAVQGMVQRMGNGNAVVQRAGGPTAPPAPVVTPEEARKTALTAARDKYVDQDNAADTPFGKVKEEVKAGLEAYLISSDSKATEIRRNVETKAKAAVEANMEGSAGTKAQKDDAKKYAAENAKASVDTTLKSYAELVTTEQVVEDKKTELKKAAKEGFNTVKPKPKITLALQEAAAQAEANKRMETLVKKLVKDTIGLSKLAIVAKSKDTTATGLPAVNVGAAGVSQVADRVAQDAALVTASDMKAVYDTALIKPIKAAVMLKLGVGRREFRRSKELNEFRQKLKDEARAKAREDIDSAIETHASTAAKGAKAKEYYAMAAKVQAYDTAKVEVDDLMGVEADAILAGLVPEAATTEILTDSGKSAAYDVFKTTPLAADKIKAAGVAAAKAKAAEVVKEQQPEAVKAARAITKGVKAVAGSATVAPVAATGRVEAKTNALVTDVKKNVHDHKVGEKAIKAAVEAGDLKSGFSKIGKLIDISTPNAGDSTSMDIELKIPIANAAGGGTAYFLFGFGGEAEREAGELTVNTQLTFGAGFKTFGFDANFRMGLFLEGKGKNTDSVMNLLSYGLYREVNSISQPAAGFFWGQGGKSGKPADKAANIRLEAEKWAMMIEEQEMVDDEASVDVGGLMKLGMEANVGVAEFSAELAFKRLSRYSKEVIEKAGKDASTGRLLTAAERIANKSMAKGEIRNVVEAATEIEVGIGKEKVAFGLEGSLTKINGKKREVSLELSANIPSQFGEPGGDFAQYGAKIVTAAVGGGKNLAGLLKKAMDKHAGSSEADEGTRAGGAITDMGSDALFTGNYFDDIGTSFAEKIQGDSTINDTMRSWLPGQEEGSSAIEQANQIALSNSLKLGAKFEREYSETGVPGEWKIGLEASQVKSLEVDAEIVKVAVEKSKRLGKIGYSSKDGIQGGALGIEK
jgi:hypothetical protein